MREGSYDDWNFSKIKVSAFVFEVDRLKKMKKSAVLEFAGTVVYSGGFYQL